MTLVTGDIGVRSKQGKSCQVVVEGDIREPVRRGMTGLAYRSELPLVRIVVLVARAAVLRYWVRQVTSVA